MRPAGFAVGVVPRMLRWVFESLGVALGIGGSQKGLDSAVGRVVLPWFICRSSVPEWGMAIEMIHMHGVPFVIFEKRNIEAFHLEIAAGSRKTLVWAGLSLMSLVQGRGRSVLRSHRGHLDSADRRGAVVWRHVKGPGGPRGSAKTSPEMQHRNLILQWLNHCSPRQRRRLADRITQQLASAEARRQEDGEGPSPTQIMSTVLFVECAGDLELQPLELHGLMHDPKVQSLEAVVALAMNQLEGVVPTVADDRGGVFNPEAVSMD